MLPNIEHRMREEEMAVKTLTRRSFTKLAAVTAAAAGLASSLCAHAALAEAETSAAASDVKHIRSSCRGCGKMECGVWVTVENGRAVKVEGDESCPSNRGHSCSKSQASLQAAYHPDRVIYPLKRTGAKGDDPAWVRVSWDEAIQTCATKFSEMIEQYGGECLVCFGGTSRVWCMGSYGDLKVLLDTPNGFLGYQICKGPRHMAEIMTDNMGSNWMETVMQPKVYVQWGTACEYSNYDDSCRTVVDASQCGDKHILIDPRQGALGKEADYWLNIRPGTDGYIAQCWTNLIIQNQLYDDLYVKRWMNAPFLVSEDIEPSGGYIMEGGGGVHVSTRLLKESDLKEGGSWTRYMVWDSLAGTDDSHPLHTNDSSGHLTWFDAATCLWEGETEYRYPTTGFTVEQPERSSGVAPAWFPDATTFDPEIDPALYGEFDVTLANGKEVRVRPVWELYAERCAEYTPERTAELTGVDAKVIEEACVDWATRRDPRYGNGGLHFQLATDQTGNSTHLVRMLMALSHMTGNYDSPAGNRGETKARLEVSPGVVPMSLPTLPEGVTYFMANEKMIGGDKYPLLRYWNKWAEATAIWDGAITGEPYRIRGGIAQSGNFMAMSNCGYGWEALKTFDFMAVIDMWFTPQADLADIIMPCVHWLEAESPRCSQGASGGIGATCKTIEAPGEARIDYAIDIDLWKAMGRPWNDVNENPQWDAWPSAHDHLDWCCRFFEPAPTWDEFVEKFQRDGWWEAKDVYPERWGTYHRHEMGEIRQTGAFTMYDTDGKPGFFTPTGKVELWSTIVESYGLDSTYEHYQPTLADCLPIAREPYVSPLTMPEKFEGDNAFNCTTGRRNPVYFHSEHRQLPWCREQWPVPRVEMNPADAERLGLQQGDWVWIENENGKIREVVDLYYGIEPGVVNLEHTWWYPEIKAVGHGWEHSACNQLVYKDYNDPFCGSNSLRCYDVHITKATAENSPFGNPVPCDSDGTPIITSADDPRLKKWLPTYEGRE